jgi:hypothetical protein
VVSAATHPSWLADIMAVSPEALGLVMLEADVHAWRLDRATELAAVRDALADGAATAEALRARFPDLAPHEIAAELDVPVARPMPIRWSDRSGLPNTRGAALHSALGRVALLDARSQATWPRGCWGWQRREVFIAHELFHHIEATRSDTPIARRYQPTLFRIGLALADRHRGAGRDRGRCIAQSLLGLPCHPRVLDLHRPDAIGPDATAARIAARIAAPHRPSHRQLCRYNRAGEMH